MKRVLIGAGFVALWAAALAFVLHAAMRYETTPGAQDAQKPVLESDQSRQWTCVMVAHPLCPCTRVSLVALKAVMAKHSGAVSCRIVFAGQRPDEPSANMVVAESIPGADIDWISAEEAVSKYHTFTSGQVFVYKRSGELAFSGGITPGRGVDQPRYALDLFEAIFEGRAPMQNVPVFGCSIGNKK